MCREDIIVIRSLLGRSKPLYECLYICIYGVVDEIEIVV